MYNITTQVSRRIDTAWKSWLLEQYLPSVMATGLFLRYQLVRLIEVEDGESITYAVQLYSDGLDHVSKFRQHYLQKFQMQEQERWGNDIFSFSSLMEVIN